MLNISTTAAHSVVLMMFNNIAAGGLVTVSCEMQNE